MRTRYKPSIKLRYWLSLKSKGFSEKLLPTPFRNDVDKYAISIFPVTNRLFMNVTKPKNIEYPYYHVRVYRYIKY